MGTMLSLRVFFHHSAIRHTVQSNNNDNDNNSCSEYRHIVKIGVTVHVYTYIHTYIKWLDHDGPAAGRNEAEDDFVMIVQIVPCSTFWTMTVWLHHSCRSKLSPLSTAYVLIIFF